MKGRDLSKYRLGNIPEHSAIELGVPAPITVEAMADGLSATVLIELDLAVEPDDDVVGLLFPALDLYNAGLDPVLSVGVIPSGVPVRVCSLLVRRPPSAVTLMPGMVLAHLVMLEIAGRPITHDPYLSLHASPDDLPYLGLPDPDPQ